MTRKHFISAVLAFAVAAVLLAACKASDTEANLRADSSTPSAAVPAPDKAAPDKPAPDKPSPESPAAEAARRVTPAELRKMLDGGQAVVYDTRTKAAYDQEHIKGALSMPSNDVDTRRGELPKNKTIIFYCT
jgi:hypothetical protein